LIRVTRKYRFSASHRLHVPGLPDDKNRELYGKCDNPFGHGHNYEVEISARGPVEARSGRAVDLRLLDALVTEQVLGPLDYRNMNTDIPAFKEIVPTTENLAREIYRRLKSHWKSAFAGEWPVLEKVRIAETPRNIFEVSGANG
jgi:6-pyruvoyltetrahydropterin/6-carboxytetrahydropterin synthase